MSDQPKSHKLEYRTVDKGMLESLYMQALPSMKSGQPSKAGPTILALIRYCCGWGVVDTPPEEYVDREDIQLLALSPHQVRAQWVMYEIFEGDQHSWLDVVETVLALTTGVTTLGVASANGTPVRVTTKHPDKRKKKKKKKKKGKRAVKVKPSTAFPIPDNPDEIYDGG